MFSNNNRKICAYFPGGSDGKTSVYNEGDLGSIPASGRFPGEGNGNPLQYSCLENPMDGGAWCRLLSMGSQRVGHDWATSHEDFLFPGLQECKEKTPVLNKCPGKEFRTEQTVKKPNWGVQFYSYCLFVCFERISTSWNLAEMKIKTTITYQLTPVRMAFVKKTTNNKRWRGCGEKGTLLYWCWHC